MGLQPGETLQAKLERLRPTIFDPDFEPIQTNQKKGDDIIATSSVNLYGRGLTQKHMDELPLEWTTRLNVRFGLKTEKWCLRCTRLEACMAPTLKPSVIF